MDKHKYQETIKQLKKEMLELSEQIEVWKIDSSLTQEAYCMRKQNLCWDYIFYMRIQSPDAAQSEELEELSSQLQLVGQRYMNVLNQYINT